MGGKDQRRRSPVERGVDIEPVSINRHRFHLIIEFAQIFQKIVAHVFFVIGDRLDVDELTRELYKIHAARIRILSWLWQLEPSLIAYNRCEPTQQPQYRRLLGTPD